MNVLKMSLLENSDSFLRESLARSLKADQDVSEWKFAIFSLVQSIELALKARLRNDHPILIFTDVDNPRNTLSMDKTINRLVTISKVDFSENDKNALKTAREWRNLIVHYEFEFSVETVKPVFAKLFGFLSTFNRVHLKREVSALLPKQLWNKSIEIDEYANELLDRALKRIAEEKRKWICTCIRCYYNTFVADKGVDQCYLCGHAEETVVCQECGEGLFASEAYKVNYGKWYHHTPEGKKLDYWYPHLCRPCYEKHLQKKEVEDEAD